MRSIKEKQTVEELTDEYCSQMGYLQTAFVRNIFEYAWNKGNSNNIDELEKQKDIASELNERVMNCRSYLMGVDADKITVEDALIALGYQSNGL